MGAVVEALGSLPPALVYLLVAAVVAAETAVLAGLVLPSLTVLLFVGFLARLGVLDVRLVVLVAVAAALVGDHVAYQQGLRQGARLRASRAGRWVGPDRWARADAALARRGGVAVLAGRLVTVVRTLVPRLAGTGGVGYATFTAFNAVGVLLWAPTVVLAGYLAGASYERVAQELGRSGAAVGVLLACVAVLVLVGRWLGQHPHPVRAVGRALSGSSPGRWLGRHHVRLVGRLHGGFGRVQVWAITVAGALALMVVAGLLLAAATRYAVRLSGVADLDAALAGWLAQRREDRAVAALSLVLAVLRPALVVAAVAVVALALALPALRRSSLTESDVLNSVGLVVPLAVLTLVTGLPGPQLPLTEDTVVTAGLFLLAWVATRYRPWPVRVTAWTVAAVLVTFAAWARLHTGQAPLSAVLTSVLLGLLWNVVLVVAWRTCAGVGPTTVVLRLPPRRSPAPPAPPD
jgi:undecaprenyl-diphosphatase